MKTCVQVALALLVLLVGTASAQQNVPVISFESVPDFLKLPTGFNFREVPGVAVNSKGHIFVFTRSNSANGPAYAHTAAQLLEFDRQGGVMGEIGKGYMAGPSPIQCASIKTVISGRSTRART